MTWTIRGTLIALLLMAVGGMWYMTDMPGSSYRGPLPDATAAQSRLRDELRRHVEYLAVTVGERNYLTPAAYENVSAYIQGEFVAIAARRNAALRAGRARFDEQAYQALRAPARNLILEFPGAAATDDIIVIGAHYDSVGGCPGANDNATGVAALLSIAERVSEKALDHTIRFVAFANEEPPFFQTADMGSLVHARECQRCGDRIVGMIALETMACYSDAPNSQMYPAPFSLAYPSTGNFIAFVGNIASRPFLHDVVRRFRQHAEFPSQGGAIPDAIQGVGWSDHWSFWQIGVPAIMVTDTAPFRYAHYHLQEDTIDKLDFDRFARVVDGLIPTIEGLAGAKN